MNIRFVRKIIGLILSALLLTAIVLLAGTTAAAQLPITVQPLAILMNGCAV